MQKRLLDDAHISDVQVDVDLGRVSPFTATRTLATTGARPC